MKSVSSGRVVPKTCKSWLCAECNTWLREGARAALAAGAMNRPPGWDAALFTFTDTGLGLMDLPTLQRRMECLVKAMRRRSWLGEYGMAVEFQPKRDALHVHMVGQVPGDLVPRLRPHGEKKRNREQYRFHFHELVPVVRDRGLGPVCDAESVETFNGAASYAVKSLASYATKETMAKFKRVGAKRIRPVRFSRNYVPERLREFQRGDKCDPGPWEDVSLVCGP